MCCKCTCDFTRVCPTDLGCRGEILFSRKLGFLESGTDVESVMSGIRLFTKYWQAVGILSNLRRPNHIADKFASHQQVGQIPLLDRFLLHNPIMKRYGPDVPMLSFAVNRLKERLAWKT